MKLSKDKKEKISKKLIKYFKENLEIELSDFQSDMLIEFLLKDISPILYNQAINDVETFIKNKLTDLEGDLKEEEN